MSHNSHDSCVIHKWRFLDEINEHPMEIGLSLALIVYGVGFLFISFPNIPHIPNWFVLIILILFSVLAIIGGLSVIVGKLVRHKYLWAYGLERAGLFLSASAWSTSVLGSIVSMGQHISINALVNLCVIVMLAIACLIRARAIGKKADVILNVLRYANEQKGDDG